MSSCKKLDLNFLKVTKLTTEQVLDYSTLCVHLSRICSLAETPQGFYLVFQLCHVVSPRHQIISLFPLGNVFSELVGDIHNIIIEIPVIVLDE